MPIWKQQTRFGGADRDRTDDPLLAKQVLSQLSYSPIKVHLAKMVGLGRFELPTSPLSGVRSNQLSYRPKVGRPGRPRTSAAAQYKSHFMRKGFEDKVERADKLRSSRLSCKSDQPKRRLNLNSISAAGYSFMVG
jgi:hypothetical protein